MTETDYKKAFDMAADMDDRMSENVQHIRVCQKIHYKSNGKLEGGINS